MTYMLIMISMFVVVSLTVERLLGKFLPLSLQVMASAAISVPLYQLFVYLDLGYVEPFYMVAILVQVPVALVVSICTIFLARRLRRE